MRLAFGDYTVGDIGLPIEIVADITLSGSHEIHFIKPSGKIIKKTASISGATATYTWQSGDLDEDGTWEATLYNSSTGYYYKSDGRNNFTVVPKPGAQGRAR